MNTDNVYQFFGSGMRAAKSIGLDRGAFYAWVRRGYIPFLSQKKLEAASKGALIARKEDAKKEIVTYCFLMFRYYDEKYGMCDVESIHFRKGKGPKIICKKHNKPGNFTVFTTTNLMQAINLLDSECVMVYEGDICLLKTREKFIVKNMSFAHKLSKLGKFKIIGNVFEKK